MIKQKALLKTTPNAYPIADRIPALISIYNIKKKKYIYVNKAIKTILGYSKEDILEKGQKLFYEIIHPHDLQRIIKETKQTLKAINKHIQDESTFSFTYRIRHKKGYYLWFHTNNLVLTRDKKNKVETILANSVDITDFKKRELETQLARDLVEAEKNLYLHNQLLSTTIRAEIADVFRKNTSLTGMLTECLNSIVKNLNATFSRIWLVNDNGQIELTASAGDYPPVKSIRKVLSPGEFAGGLVAKTRKPYVTNNIYQNNFFHIQNIAWSKKKKLISFAGYPLFSRNNLVGVITIFSSRILTEDIIDVLSNVTDIIAQEIERQKIEQKLSESHQRYLSFITQSSEGIWRIELEKPMPVTLSPKKQIDWFYTHSYLAECNDAMAKMYGYNSSDDLVGARLGDLLVRTDPANIDYLLAFIASGYKLSNTESVERDRYDNLKYFQNNLLGIVEHGMLLRAWGIQQDVTEKVAANLELLKLSKQKDEFIAIASHELKTPVTSLKAYTQILENRFKKSGDTLSADMLNRMDLQINKLTILISDLLDVSKIEAGKLQFHLTTFKLNQLINEIAAEMQCTTEKHRIQLKLDVEVSVKGDRDRIGQVLINFISNAIKYSPDSKKIIIKTMVTDSQITVTVQDFGLGISKEEQSRIFERFFRTTNPQKESFPGLGMGLYISSEIIKRHNGEIGVKSKKGKGSTFFFSLPLN